MASISSPLVSRCSVRLALRHKCCLVVLSSATAYMHRWQIGRRMPGSSAGFPSLSCVVLLSNLSDACPMPLGGDCGFVAVTGCSSCLIDSLIRARCAGPCYCYFYCYSYCFLLSGKHFMCHLMIMNNNVR